MGIKKPFKPVTKRDDEIPELEAVESKIVSLMDEEQRAAMIATVEALGYLNADKLSDSELMDKLRELAIKKQDENLTLRVAKATDGLEDKLKYYIEGTLISDLVFAEKLFTANVDKRYLHLFRDADVELITPVIKPLMKKNDKGEEYQDGNYEDGYRMDKIWEKIRFSGINLQKDQPIFRRQFIEPLLVTPVAAQVN